MQRCRRKSIELGACSAIIQVLEVDTRMQVEREEGGKETAKGQGLRSRGLDRARVIDKELREAHRRRCIL